MPRLARVPLGQCLARDTEYQYMKNQSSAMDFERHTAKEQAKEARYRFPNCREGVLGPYVIEFDDFDNNGELRCNAIGLVDGRLLFVTYTLRGDVVRIISARGAEPHEKRKYHEL